MRWRVISVMFENGCYVVITREPRLTATGLCGLYFDTAATVTRKTAPHAATFVLDPHARQRHQQAQSAGSCAQS